jgi:hypothetical protein
MSNGKTISFGLQLLFNRAVRAALAELDVDPLRATVNYEDDTESFILTVKIPKPLITPEKEVK